MHFLLSWIERHACSTQFSSQIQLRLTCFIVKYHEICRILSFMSSIFYQYTYFNYICQHFCKLLGNGGPRFFSIGFQNEAEKQHMVNKRDCRKNERR